MYYHRTIENTINKAIQQFPCITLYGARQVGKSTLIRNIFGNKINYISLDDSELKQQAENDPKLFLDDHEWPIIIDEIQKAPSLLNEIKIRIDNITYECLKKDEKVPFMYVLSGSNQLDLRSKVDESLAGRTAILKLWSLSNNEIMKIKGSLFNPEIDIIKEKYKKLNIEQIYKTRKQIFNDIFRGGMPNYVINKLDREIYFSSYISTYIEKDIIKNIGLNKENDFRRFLNYMALRTAQQINYDDISRSIGIDARTVKSWISLLITTGIAFTLEPYARNLSDRVVKNAKFYFADTGLCSYLCKWQDAEMLENGIMNGAFFETYCISEIIKSFINNNVDYIGKVFYYRDRDKKEVDLIIEYADCIVPIEIKKGVDSIKPNFNFNFLNKYGKKILNGLVINSRKDIVSVDKNVYQIPLFMIGI